MIPRIVTALQVLEQRLGYRGSRLVQFGSIWFLIGVSTLVEPVPPHPLSAMLLHEVVPGHLVAGVWMVTGMAAIAIGLRKVHDDSWAWAALTVMPTFRLLSWAFSWVAWAGTSVLHQFVDVRVVGFSSGLSGALVYLMVLSLVSSSARHRCDEQVMLPRPPELPPRVDDEGRG